MPGAPGADAVVVLDTDDVGELAGRFAEAAGGGVDLVLDPLYGVPAAAAARALRPGGRLVNLGSSAHEHAPIDSSHAAQQVAAAARLHQQRAHRRSVARRRSPRWRRTPPQGRLTVAREVLPLDAVAEAWQRQAEGRTTGRIVLSMQAH